jgi:hypothetical protein
MARAIRVTRRQLRSIIREEASRLHEAGADDPVEHARQVLHDVIDGRIPLGSAEEDGAFAALEQAGIDIDDVAAAVQEVTILDPNDLDQDAEFVEQMRRTAHRLLDDAIDGV